MNRGFKLVSDGTDNHLMLVNLTNMDITGKEAQLKLDDVCITCNKNGIPFDTQKPSITSGIRLGTPAVTSRGMNEADMDEIADLIHLTITDFEASQDNIRKRVADLCSRYPLYK
jgi:glycine hydroxymethyltransferase